MSSNFAYIITGTPSKVLFYEDVPINKTGNQFTAPPAKAKPTTYDVIEAWDLGTDGESVGDKAGEKVEGALYRFGDARMGGRTICHWIIDAPNPTAAAINTPVGKAVVLFGTTGTRGAKPLEPKIVPVLAADRTKTEGGKRMYYFQVIRTGN